MKMIVLLALSAWPLTSQAGGVDIPELGVHIEAPQGTPAPQVLRRLDGYEAILRFGAASLAIAWIDEPVPAGSHIQDAAFQAIQHAAFSDDVGPGYSGQKTVIAGLDAWTSCGARSAADRVGGDYTCITYVIVDQHLYRLIAHATGGQTRPPEFDSAVRAMSELTFRPVDRSAPSASVAATGLLRMPPMKIARNRDWYPPAARLRSEQGVVDLEFSIDRKGHAQDVRETLSATKTLVAAATELLNTTVFGVGPGWDDDHEHARLGMEVQFGVAGGGGHCAVGQAPRVPGAMVVTICTSSLRPARSPLSR